MPKRVIERRLAEQDVRDILDFYRDQCAPHAVRGFAQSLTQAYEHIGRHPATGCPRDIDEANLPGMRTWTLKTYPYRVFYIECDEYIDVHRVLHQKRDIPGAMQGRS